MNFARRCFIYLLSTILVVVPFHAAAQQHSPWTLIGANERIKKFRTGTARLEFLGPDGKILKQELLVKVKLKKHAFHFGIGMGQSWALFDQKNFERYRNYLGEVFNLFALGFQWSWIEKKRGQIKKIPHIESNLNWAKSKDITLKGMPLVWHNAIPRWLNKITNPEEIELLIAERIRYLIEEYPDVSIWNLYNEAVGAEKDFNKNNVITNWLKFKGGPVATQAWITKVAREFGPEKIFVNNHYSHRDPAFKEMNRELSKMGVKFDAIGIQTHMHTEKTQLSEKDLWRLLEDYKVFGKTIHLTEISVPSSIPFKNWNDFRPHVEALKQTKNRDNRSALSRYSVQELEKYQADYLLDFYTLAFSHPNVESLIYWSGSDLYEWRGTAAGLLDLDQNPKPAYHTLKGLIKKEWHTEIAKNTEESGKFSFSGFYGGYIGKATLNGKKTVFEFDHRPGKTGTHIIQLN